MSKASGGDAPEKPRDIGSGINGGVARVIGGGVGFLFIYIL